MKVAFDYLAGPVLGHKQRCLILKDALVACGHEIVDRNKAKDWLVYDYPYVTAMSRFSVARQGNIWNGTVPDPAIRGARRLFMGQYPRGINAYAWHPLGQHATHTLTDASYIMVDPYIKQLYATPKTKALLITCGGADPYHLTERLVARLGTQAAVTLIIGPNFKRAMSVPVLWDTYYEPAHHTMLRVMAQHETIICAWGQTAFEAIALGAKVLPVLTTPEHILEAERLAIASYLTRFDSFRQIDKRLSQLLDDSYGIDMYGVYRLIAMMERGNW